MNNTPRIYLSGPDLFHPDGWDIAEKKKEVCHRYGLEGVSPFDLPDGRPFDGTAERARTVYADCVELMKNCDGLIANVSPFRGPSLDGATAYEMGFMHGLGKPVASYTLDRQGYAARMIKLHTAFDVPLEPVQDHFRAPDGLLVENFGLGDSLMPAGASSASGVVQSQDFEGAVRWIRRLVLDD
ncbi:MAG: nucleoside 2-deoxyribosyltransferase [Rhodospirillaceae bacterium]|jgi:nucleoside 2-deoxyribosyltransferase